MTFTPSQIQQILEIIQFNHILFIAKNVSTDVLTPDEKRLLLKYGIRMEDFKGFTPIELNFYFGRLVAALGDKNARKLNYNNFLQYMRRGQYVPLNDKEKFMLNLAKQRTYSHLKNLESRVTQSVHGIILETSNKFRPQFEKVVKRSIERAMLERNSISSVISEIGHKTGDWNRDLGRIAATEMQTIFQEGIAAEIENRYGEQAEVYKDVFDGACRYCISFYTTGGIGTQPRIFRLSELRANGTNIGKKQAEWTGTVGSTHPWCKCDLRYLPKGWIWDESSKSFMPPHVDITSFTYRRKGIKITVGDQVFNI